MRIHFNEREVSYREAKTLGKWSLRELSYTDMKVIVYNNQIEKAIRDLKRKLSKEGFYSEIKERRFYDKPSVQKKKKQAKAAKRLRKKMRKF